MKFPSDREVGRVVGRLRAEVLSRLTDLLKAVALSLVNDEVLSRASSALKHQLTYDNSIRLLQ